MHRTDRYVGLITCKRSKRGCFFLGAKEPAACHTAMQVGLVANQALSSFKTYIYVCKTCIHATPQAPVFAQHELHIILRRPLRTDADTDADPRGEVFGPRYDSNMLTLVGVYQVIIDKWWEVEHDWNIHCKVVRSWRNPGLLRMSSSFLNRFDQKIINIKANTYKCFVCCTSELKLILFFLIISKHVGFNLFGCFHYFGVPHFIIHL